MRGRMVGKLMDRNLNSALRRKYVDAVVTDPPYGPRPGASICGDKHEKVN